MATTAIARDGDARRRDANRWVLAVIIAAWVIVLLSGYLVAGLG
jgi:hypothetical protein